MLSIIFPGYKTIYSENMTITMILSFASLKKAQKSRISFCKFEFVNEMFYFHIAYLLRSLFRKKNGSMKDAAVGVWYAIKWSYSLMNSTLRFLALFSGVSLAATGCFSPAPSVSRREASMPN